MARKKKKISICNSIGILLMLAGAALFFYPDMKDWYMERQAVKLSEDFRAFSESRASSRAEEAQAEENATGKESVRVEDAVTEAFISAATPEFLEHIRAYNREIYENGQKDFKNAWSVAQTPVAVSGLEDGMFGYIEIPAMDCLLPLYIGASDEHMSQGAAVLGGTSIPIGGSGTNSVIAGHRGWKQRKYFKNIEELSLGDQVYITNPWETLTYRVEAIDIIEPDDSDKLKIKGDGDRITLFTCHPYRSHGKYRYVVYCVRDDGREAPAVTEPEENRQASWSEDGVIVALDGNVYRSSAKDIWLEILVRRACAVVILVLVGITICVKGVFSMRDMHKKIISFLLAACVMLPSAHSSLSVQAADTQSAESQTEESQMADMQSAESQTEESQTEEISVAASPEESEMASEAVEVKYIMEFDTSECPTILAKDGSWEEILAQFPSELPVTLSDGAPDRAPVTWGSDNEVKFCSNPESVQFLQFDAELDEGWELGGDLLFPPAVIVKMVDPYGIALAADVTGTLSVGDKITYGSYYTRHFTFNGNEAYCGNPAKSAPSSGSYTASSIDPSATWTDEWGIQHTNAQIVAGLWYGYGGPGFDRSMWPSTWYDGSAMTADRYRALTHIVLSWLYTNNVSYSVAGTSSSFRSWVENSVIGFKISDGSEVNPNAIALRLAYYAFMLRGDGYAYTSVPAGFTAYEVYTGSNKQVILTSEYQRGEQPGYLQVYKTSVSTGHAVSGAVYRVYTDAACTAQAKTAAVSDGVVTGNSTTDAVLTTTGDGYSNTVTLKPGTYYIKEYSCPGSYILSTTVSTAVVTEATTNTTSVKDNEQPYFTIKKTDAQNSNAVIAGATYYLYTDEACTTIATDINGNEAKLVTTSGGSNQLQMPVGTYYLKESGTGNEYYQLNSAVVTIDLAANQVKTQEVTNKRLQDMYLQKTSANTGLTDGNRCYSLAGAVYYVYTDSTCTTRAVDGSRNPITLTTDATGKTNTVKVLTGTYYIKEITASPGYAKCDGTDGASGGVHRVTVSYGQTAVVTCQEPPLHDRFPLTLTKADADTKGAPVNGSSLAGAVFEVKYYDNVTGATTGTAKKTWYFETKERDTSSGKQGYFRISDVSCFLSSKAYADGTVFTSDDLYLLDGAPAYLLGTYTLKEVVPPALYQLEGSMSWTGTTNRASVTTGLRMVLREENDAVQIYDGNDLINGQITADNLAVNTYDEVYHKGSVRVCKKNNADQPVQGVTYRLVGLSSGKTYTATTDAEGKASFTELIPEKYVLTEANCPDGVTLLADNIDVTMPIQMTKEEAQKAGADTAKAVFDKVSGTYCFYDLTYNIKNDVSFRIPMTGASDQYLVYAGGAIAAVMIGGGAWLLFRKKKGMLIR